MEQINKQVTTVLNTEALFEVFSNRVYAGFPVLAAAINTSNHAALDQFEVRGRIGNRAVTLASVSTDYTNRVYPIIGASGNLAALAANATGWVFIDLTGLSYVALFAARAAGSDTTVIVDAYCEPPTQ